MPPEGLTSEQFGRLAGVTRQSVNYHIRQGTIRRLPNGRLNPADASLLIMGRQASERAAPDPRGARLLKARTVAGAVKVRRLTLQIAEAQRHVVERQALTGGLAERCDAIVARVSSWPARYAGMTAELADVPVQVATEILGAFVNIALQELGDLHAEAARCVGP